MVGKYQSHDYTWRYNEVLTALDVERFHDYKLVVKQMTEYSKTLRIVCGEDFTTREAIIKLHHLVHDQIFEIAFEDMRQYAFQKALL